MTVTEGAREERGASGPVAGSGPARERRNAPPGPQGSDMTKRPGAIRADYDTAYYRAMAAYTVLGLVLEEYPQPPGRGDGQRAAELGDIAAGLEAMTAGWAAGQLAAAETG
mgnify:CR=1 FL=1